MAMGRDDKRLNIIQAAERLFTDRRFHEITLSEIAKVAAVGKGTIYQYFEDKDDLFFHTATSGFDALCALLRRKVPEQAPFEEQLLDACAQIGAFFGHRRPLLRMMQSEDARMLCSKGKMCERWNAKRVKLVEALAGIVRKGVAEKKVRADVPAEVLAEFLLGMLRTRTRRLENAPEAVRGYALVTDLFRNGAAARPEACPPAGRRGCSQRRPSFKARD